VEAWYRAQGKNWAAETEGAKEKLLAKLGTRGDKELGYWTFPTRKSRMVEVVPSDKVDSSAVCTYVLYAMIVKILHMGDVV
jgi:hypothetical protein